MAYLRSYKKVYKSLREKTIALREAIGAPLQPIERADYDHTVAAVRGHLGEEAFVSAWAEGHTMTAEQMFATGERTKISFMKTTQPQRVPGWP